MHPAPSFPGIAPILLPWHRPHLASLASPPSGSPGIALVALWSTLWPARSFRVGPFSMPPRSMSTVCPNSSCRGGHGAQGLGLGSDARWALAGSCALTLHPVEGCGVRGPWSKGCPGGIGRLPETGSAPGRIRCARTHLGGSVGHRAGGDEVTGRRWGRWGRWWQWDGGDSGGVTLWWGDTVVG